MRNDHESTPEDFASQLPSRRWQTRRWRAFSTLARALATSIYGVSAFGQTITTVPVSNSMAATPVPANGFWVLALLAGTLAAVGAWLIRSRQTQGAMSGLLGLVFAVCLLVAASYNPSVRAALAPWMLSFTQPSGETLSIPVLASPVEGTPTDFTPVQFRNDSGVVLKIASMTGPGDFAACFPNGIPSALPATPLPPGAMACVEGLQLASGASCVVDVAAMCAQGVTAISLSPETLTFDAGSTGIVTISTHPGAAQPATGVTATFPPGSQLTIQSSTCGAALAPGGSCAITLAGDVVEGPTSVVIAGANTNTLTASATVAPGPAHTVGGTVAGLSGSSVVLQNNGADDMSLCSNGSFTFPTPVAAGIDYQVTVGAQPSGAICTVSNGSGVMGAGNVTNVTVSCTAGTAGSSRSLAAKGWGC